MDITGRTDPDFESACSCLCRKLCKASHLGKNGSKNVAIKLLFFMHHGPGLCFVKLRLIEQDPHTFQAIAARGAAHHLVQAQLDAVLFGKSQPTGRVVRHGVDHGAVHVENQGLGVNTRHQLTQIQSL